MTRQEFHTKTYYYLALLIAFCLPFARLTPAFIALMLLNWIIEGDLKNKLILLSKNKFALLFIAFYGMHLIGMLYTQNTNSGRFDLEVKFSLLAFPLVLATRPFNNKDTDSVFFAFIIGGVISALILLGRALYCYVYLNENCFFYMQFSYFLHPSYLSMYLNIAIAWLLLGILKHEFSKQAFSNLFALIIIIFFSLIIVLLSSKMGMFTTVLIFIGFLIYYIYSRKKYTLGIAGILLMTIMIYSVIRFVPAISDRVNTAISAITNTTVDKTESESTAVRLLIWNACNQVISENKYFGTGTGDAKDELLKEYEKQGMTGALEHKLNTHNEFYQVFVSLGLIGFTLLLGNLLIPLIFAFKIHHTMYLFFLLIIVFNFLSESMLETQAGVMFYAYFNSLFCFKLTPNLQAR